MNTDMTLVLQGVGGFTALVVLTKAQKKDVEMDALQAGMAALQVQQQQQQEQQQRDQDRQRRKEEEKLRDSLEYRAIHSLYPRSDMRMRLVLDTNIYLHTTRDAERTWDQFERDHCGTAKVLIPQVVLEEIDRKRHDRNADMSSHARAMMRYLERKFKSARGGRDSFWELQEREIDERYKRKVGSQAGNRSCDLRIFYFVRDCHRQREGCMTLVTNDQPLALEGASVGVPTISQQQLFTRRHVYQAPPSTETRTGRDSAAVAGATAQAGQGTGKSTGGVELSLARLSLEQPPLQQERQKEKKMDSAELLKRKQRAEDERQQRLEAVANAEKVRTCHIFE